MRRKIFRVENENGQGPYTTLGTASWATGDHCDMNHPAPYEEGLPRSKHHVCCFDSMEQLHNWFNDIEIDNLHAHAYDITETEVDDEYLHFGEMQCVCIRDEQIDDYLEDK